MNDTLTYQLCAAVSELIAMMPESPGPACRRFQNAWQDCRDSGNVSSRYFWANGMDDAATHVKARPEALPPGCFSGRKQADFPGSSGTSCDDARKTREEAEARAAQAHAALEAKRRERLPEQQQFAALQTFLNELPPDVISLLSAYYTPDSLLTFLVQCGQFNRLCLFWEACVRAVSRGASGGPLTACLRRLLEVHNLSGDAPAATIEPQPGDRYDYTISDRIASDGNIVSELLLPGLRNAGGKTTHKALVRLAQGRGA